MTNGGFEAPVTTDPSFDNVTGNMITGWTIAPNKNVDLVRGFFDPSEGKQSIDLNGGSPGEIYQDLTTVVGKKYKIQFDLAGNPFPDGVDPGAYIKHLDLSWGGSFLSSYAFDTLGHGPHSMGWETITAFATATSTSSRLDFKSTSGSVSGPALDNVHVDAVTPEGSSLLSLCGGLVAAGFAALRRRRK